MSKLRTFGFILEAEAPLDTGDPSVPAPVAPPTEMPTSPSLSKTSPISPVMDTHDRLRTLARDNRTVLKFLLQLYDLYRGDDKQLSSKEAGTAMVGVLRSMAAQSIPDIAQYGNIEWKPDPISFIEFFDSIGDKSMAEFLGISDMSDIPGVDLEMRADEIRSKALKSREADAGTKEDASKIVAGAPKKRNLAEHCGNHVLARFAR